MKNGMKFIAAAVLVGIVLLAGCQKKGEPAAPAAPSTIPTADANAAAAEVSTEQTPSSEHPTGEHPTGDHPK
jgi:outer membrane murein-binding lipoprotein Lpp